MFILSQEGLSKSSGKTEGGKETPNFHRKNDHPYPSSPYRESSLFLVPIHGS
jgi:hypothetical protein